MVLGVAGASFAIALPMVSYWYPPEHQGTALGLAGAGNSGTVFASLFAPMLAVALGWRNVLGLAALPLIAVFVLFPSAAKNSPNCPPKKTMADYARLLKQSDSWWLMFFYAVSFGGFVGLSSFLPIYFHDQYKLSPVTAGYFTAACVFAGSFARPFGGYLADRIGGTRALSVVYAIVAAILLLVSRSVPAGLRRAGGVHRRHGDAGHGQWRGVPTGAAALRPRCRPDDRPGRHDRRHRRLLSRRQPGLRQAVHRQLRLRLRRLRRHGAGGLGRHQRGPAALAARSLRPRHRAHLREPAMNMITDPREHLVVIGNGMAGMRTVEELLKLRCGQRFRITVFGAEPHVNYNRIMLSSVLAGDKSVDEIVINSRDWYDENGITLITGDAVDRASIAATATVTAGQRPHRALRQAADRHRLAAAGAAHSRAWACPASAPSATSPMSTRCWPPPRTHKRAVVIGGGLLGLEAAWGLKQRGMSVALVHLMPTLMERQLDAAAGQLLQRDLDRRGIAFFTDGQTEEITGTERAEGVQLADGRFVPADLVVLAIGIRPNIDLAQGGAAGRQSRHRRRPTTCAPAIPTSSRSANASSIAAMSSAWWRRSGTRPRSAPRGWPATRRRLFASGRCPPASRSPAWTCSRPAR